MFILEFVEYLFYHLPLQRGRYLVVEGKLLDYEVEVVQKGVSHVLPNLEVEGWLDVEGLVWLFKPFDPDVKPLQLLVNQVHEFVWFADHASDGAGQEWKEG